MTALAASELPWPLGPDAAFMAERAAAVMPAVVLSVARGGRSEHCEGRLDLRGISERGCEHLLDGDGVRAPATAIATMALTSD